MVSLHISPNRRTVLEITLPLYDYIRKQHMESLFNSWPLQEHKHLQELQNTRRAIIAHNFMWTVYLLVPLAEGELFICFSFHWNRKCHSTIFIMSILRGYQRKAANFPWVKMLWKWITQTLKMQFLRSLLFSVRSFWTRNQMIYGFS